MQGNRIFQQASKLLLASESVFKLVDLIYGAIYIIFMREKGLSIIEISLITSFSTLFLFVFEIPSGVVADIFGRKRNAALGYLLFGLSFLVFLQASSFIWFVLSSLLMQLGIATISGSPDAWYFDLSIKYNQKEERKKFLMKAAVVVQICAMLGAAIGAAIDVIGIQFLCYFCFALCLSIAIMFLFFSEENFGKKQEHKLYSEVIYSMRAFAKDKNMRKLIVFQIFETFSFHAFILGWQIYALDVLGVNKSEIGILLIVFMVIMFFAKLTLQKIGKKYKETTLMLATFTAFVIAYALMFLVASNIGFIVGAVLFEFSLSIFLTTKRIWIHEIIPSSSRSTYASALSTIDAIIAFIATLILGVVMGEIGVNYIWLAGLVASLLGGVYIKKYFNHT